MRYSTLLPTLLLASQVAAVVIMPQQAAALSTLEVDAVAHQVTVKIFGGGTLGTGTIISKIGNRYTVLTAGHVVKENTAYRAIAPDGKTHVVTAKVVPVAGIDLAAITFTSDRVYPVATIRDSAALKIGEQIYTAGFPGIQPKYTFGSGHIEANSNSNFRQGYSLMYQCQKIAPGMSGGGVFNRQGELIAITGMSIGAHGANVREGLAAGIGSHRFLPWAITANLLRENSAHEPEQLATADDFLVTGMDQSDRREPASAIINFDRAIALKPDYAIAYYRRGLSKEQTGDRQGAIADYSRTIALKPNSADLYLARGSNQGIIGNWYGALNDYNAAIYLRPNDAFAHSIRGLYKSVLGDLNGSIADYDRSIALQPNYAETYKSRAVVKEKLGDQSGAIADYSQAIALKPSLSAAYERRAAILQTLAQAQVATTDANITTQNYDRQGGGTLSYRASDSSRPLWASFDRHLAGD